MEGVIFGCFRASAVDRAGRGGLRPGDPCGGVGVSGAVFAPLSARRSARPNVSRRRGEEARARARARAARRSFFAGAF